MVPSRHVELSIFLQDRQTSNVDIVGATFGPGFVYLAHVSSYSATFLIRYQKDFWRCFGSEAVAKATMKVMESCGIDTTIVKVNSVLGDAATAFLASGIDQALTRQRGGGQTLKLLRTTMPDCTN